MRVKLLSQTEKNLCQTSKVPLNALITRLSLCPMSRLCLPSLSVPRTFCEKNPFFNQLVCKFKNLLLHYRVKGAGSVRMPKRTGYFSMTIKTQHSRPSFSAREAANMTVAQVINRLVPSKATYMAWEDDWLSQGPINLSP